MTSTPGLELYLFAYLVLREILYLVQTQKMINKVMSRNYHDYVFSENVKKTLTPAGEGKVPLRESHDLPEDLAPIAGFGMN